MHSITHFLNKHNSRATTEKDDVSESWHSSLSSADSRSAVQHESAARSIPINTGRGSCGQRHFRGSPGSPFEFATSPRDRYPNFASYFREVMEIKGSPSQQYHNTHHADYRRRSDGERYQIGVNMYQPPRQDYRHFVSSLYNDAMDDIQENEYSKVERYGEISNTKASHTSIKNRFDNKSFAQKLVDCSDAKDDHYSDRRGSGSSPSGHRHKNHSIQELMRTFGKRVSHWMHDSSSEVRRGSCATPVPGPEAKTPDSDEFRSRSKSLDYDHINRMTKRSVLDDCGATYQIFDEILREGKVQCDLYLSKFNM